jgi:hypothetical protein
MDKADVGLQLLNVYEVVVDGRQRHLVCFLDPVLAGARGIDHRAVVGEFTPGPGLAFDPSTFRLNPAFVETVTGYMNEEAGRSDDLKRDARGQPGGWLYVLDPRYTGGPDEEPPAADLLGCFAVDGSGQIVPNSFLYNEKHRWFGEASGVSGVLSDRRFYDWLHSAAGP